MDNSRSSSRGAFALLALVALAVTCAVTNPDKAAHTAAIKEKLSSEVRNKGDVVGSLGMAVMGGWAETLVGGLLEYNSYGVLSTTSAKGRVVSYGALGQVFVVNMGEKPRKAK